MPRWADLLDFVEEQVDTHDCKHTLRYTKTFCKAHDLDFGRIRRILRSLVDVYEVCDCVIARDRDRFKNPFQAIDEDPDLERRLFWTNLFGYLGAQMQASPDPSMPSGYSFRCTSSFKYTRVFCEHYGLNTDEILRTLQKANAMSCDCEVMTNSTQYFEDDAIIGTEPTINLDEMRKPHFIHSGIDPERARAFRDMR